MRLPLPLYELCRTKGLCEVGSGLRLGGANLAKGPLLVIDDSVYNGHAMRWARESLARTAPDVEAIFAALYPRPEVSHCVDLYAQLAPHPHLFEWNLFNCNQTRHFAFDFDGVLCEDWPGGNEEGEEYRSFIEKAKPRWLPRRLPVKMIVTARLERHRTETKKWLSRHGIAVEKLIMGPWKTASERKRSYDVREFKGKTYADSSCWLFIESDDQQAREIFDVAKKPVLCPTTGTVYQ